MVDVSGNVLYYLNDHLGSARAVVDESDVDAQFRSHFLQNTLPETVLGVYCFRTSVTREGKSTTRA